jgi:hypothetical protein
MASGYKSEYDKLRAMCRTPEQIIAEQKNDPKKNQWYVVIDHEDDEPFMVDLFEGQLDPEDEVLAGPVTLFEAECQLEREFSLRGE